MRLVSISLLAAAMACGEVKANHIADGPTGDSTSTTPDATPHGTVMLKVLDPQGDGGPAVGVPVVFIDANGTQKTATDNNGVAMADVLAGASVTAIVNESGSQLMETILDVSPGDSLTLGENDNQTDPAEGNFIVNVNGQVSTVFGPCGGLSSNPGIASVTLPMRQSCLRTPMDLLMVVTDGSGQPTSFAEAPNIPFTSNGSTTMPSQLKSLSSFNASFTDLGGVATVNGERFAPDLFGFGSGSNSAVSGATLPLSFNVPIAQTAVMQSTFTEAGVGSGIQPPNQVITQVIPGTSTSFGLDVGATLLGWMGVPALDVTSNQVTMAFDQSTTSKDSPDVSFVEFLMQRPPPPTAAQPRSSCGWCSCRRRPTSRCPRSRPSSAM